MKKTNKKGFTLVEVIVVLVILAILAAIMIPAMTGWIDRANEKTAIVEARTVLLAAQTIASEEYATDSTKTALATAQDALDLAGLDASVVFTTDPVIAGGVVESFTITSSSGQSVAYSRTGATKFSVN